MVSQDSFGVQSLLLLHRSEVRSDCRTSQILTAYLWNVIVQCYLTPRVKSTAAPVSVSSFGYSSLGLRVHVWAHCTGVEEVKVAVN